jgi:HSP20 family protein
VATRPNAFDVLEEMDRMFDRMRRSMWRGEDRPATGASDHDREFDDEGRYDGMARYGGSNLSLEESADGYVVLADLPGFEKDEFDLRVEDNVLYIGATHEVEGEGGSRSRRVRESVRIPGSVTVDGIAATYRNGVLEVHVPVDGDGHEGHRIDIE